MPRPKKPAPARPKQRKAPKLPTPVGAVKHNDKRANIPTEELRDFVADDEKKPKTVLYPRDPSLDPQLVWKGKDEQDKQDLAVPAVPIYIQEKIQPQAIIENVRANRNDDSSRHYQIEMFADFNGIAFEDLIDFYQHEQNWSNRMILGDSLMVMASLAEKEGLKGKVQMIYMDPPYGIKFGSNWQVSTRKRDVRDGRAEDATRQPEQIKAFRDTWQLGIHSYLAYLRDRLTVARELLTETGSIFVQIGDENVHLARNILDEVFGSENFLVSIIVKKKSITAVTDPINDYLLWYSKDAQSANPRRLTEKKGLFEEGSRFKVVEFPTGERRPVRDCTQEDLATDGLRYLTDDYPLVSQDVSEGRSGPFDYSGRTLVPGQGRHWTYDPNAGMLRLGFASRLRAADNTARGIVYFDDYARTPIPNIWDFHGEADPVYVVQTNRGIVERCLLMTTDPGDLVLDPTCGSGTTAYVAEQWGRRWITVDTSRVAIALARTRLMAARYAYYLLADSAEGARRELALTPGPSPDRELRGQERGGGGGGDIKKGFVYKRVPHITLKSIANNEEIDVIHARWQEQLEPVREKINRLVKKAWEEWEVPRADDDWKSSLQSSLQSSLRPFLRDEARGNDLKSLLQEWWRLRRERQKEIDDSIARRADVELLYDQPYEDNKRIRVSGPFTVESLSPHRVIADDGSNDSSRYYDGNNQFESMIIENLKAAGVQNTVKKERLKFDRLEPYAGTWIQATGEYSENGKSKRVAVSIGPEHGTVGPDLVKEAAKEAVQGVGFDLLIVCGFAFDPHVSEEAKRYGQLTVLTARMNPDLAMGDELLKKTGAGNLFMVFGEPDLEIKRAKDGNESIRYYVEVKGLDVYDPTTGQIRSSSTDDIACWFIDTDYNGESFFVRHAYFTGADEPYERLKRALRAEIDEAAWARLYSTKSYPFDAPKSGKIAVKVINHYGDEVMKVYEVGRQTP